MAKARNGVIAALDIGTSKVVCFVARVDGQGLRVVGIGHQAAQGMRSGNIVDMEAATRAISSAVSTAEEMCGEVQTPLSLPPGLDLPLGAPVIFRHAKGGELAERFDEYLLIAGGEVVATVPTYRGEGQCFL